jgi:teichuronic acid biosynthesis glycosyltransferase TuaC
MSMHVVLLGAAFPGRPEAGVDRVHVRRACALAARAPVLVVVPTPWALRAVRGPAGRWARYAATPRRAEIDGVHLLYPRYLQVPGMGPWAGVAMALGAAATIRRLRSQRRCDVLFAQAVLPDGLAAVLLGRWLSIPVACLGRGTDVHGLEHAPAPTRWLASWTLRRSATVGVVAQVLARTLARVAGAVPCTVLPGGVDLEHFAPGSARDARRALGLEEEGRLILYVGRLAEGKGLDTLLDAFHALRTAVPNAVLALVGSGPLHARLARCVLTSGLARSVRLAGEAPHEVIPQWMRAADVVVLPSEAEGFPNVVREALACGRPVVATSVGDVPRVLTPDAGRLVPPRDPVALTVAIADVLAQSWDADRIRAHVSGMTWEDNADATAGFLAAAVEAARAGDCQRDSAPTAPAAAAANARRIAAPEAPAR